MKLRSAVVVIAAASSATALCCTGSAQAANAHYPSNREPLRSTPFVALPLGSVKADGWLRMQLEMQRTGLTGHAESVLDEIGSTSAWRGGTKDNWEKSPYYVKGLIPLAYTLDDPLLKARAQVWVESAIASQRADGFYGPSNNDDWWPRMVSNYFLRDYYEATNDARVLKLLTNYYKYVQAEMPKRPLREWGKTRIGDDMDTAIWLYNRTGEAFLLDVVDLMRGQAYDWPGIMHENRFQGFGNDFMPKHNVNVPQGLKMPAVSWQRTGDEKERTAIDVGMSFLLRDHGLSLGLQSGTEFLAGRSSGQGVEFCSIVEQMLSDETIVRIYGEGKYADRLELMAFNALPAAWNRDLTALRYYTLPNHVTAHVGTQGFGQNYGNGIVYGPRSGFPCCCFNVHHGWPKFVQNSWAATDDNGLAAIAFGPTTVTAKVGANGATATIVQETNYPFEETIRFKLTVSEPATFPLALRTPEWCEAGAKLTVNGETIEAAKPGAFKKIEREWKSGDEVVLTLPAEVRTMRGVHNSASIHRGPLIYSLQITPEAKVLGQPVPGFNETELRPATAWNYALAFDPGKPQENVELLREDVKPDANPFDPAHTPIRLKANARKLADWGLAWNGNVAFDPPHSPVQAQGEVEQITLLPFGATELRVTDFPVVGPQNRMAPRPMRFDFDKNDPTGWTNYGGGWWANDGKLTTNGNHGGPGFKSLIDGATWGGVEASADVMPAERGDAGVLVRVTKASIGADALQGYYAGISAADGFVTLGKMDGKGYTTLSRIERKIPGDKPTRVRLVAVGDQLSMYLNDEAEPVLKAVDDQWKNGQVGVRIYSTDSDRSFASFDNVSVDPK